MRVPPQPKKGDRVLLCDHPGEPFDTGYYMWHLEPPKAVTLPDGTTFQATWLRLCRACQLKATMTMTNTLKLGEAWKLITGDAAWPGGEITYEKPQ